ncbi:MAG TPA: S-layer homology domain-containing protein, partial [Symbiobacteriaceae bacterium]|nr:S-layer homology domain-containing protein [Symbiobacteriaceae bacterium]
GYEGKPIALNLDASGGRYEWVPEGLSSGTYYVYGVLSVGDHARISHYAAGEVVIQNPNTPTVPRIVEAKARNGRLILDWEPSSGVGTAGYTLRIDDGQASVSVAGNRTSYEWAGLRTNRLYRVTISAYTGDGLESPESQSVEVFLPTPKPPTLQVDWPRQWVTNAKELTIPVFTDEGATLQVFRNDDAVGQPVVGSKLMKVPLLPGQNTVRLLAIGANGDIAEETAEYVVDHLAPGLMFDNVKSPSTVSTPTLEIGGVTDPGAQVTIGAITVSAGADGRFSAGVKLAPGPNVVKVEAADVAGNVTAQELNITYKVCGTLFPDVTSGMRACGAIEQLHALKVLSGYPDGSFQPNRGVTRAEFSKMLVVALGQVPQPNRGLTFTDVSSHWATTGGYLQAAVSMGALNGFPDGTFQPDQPVTRSQAVKIAAAAAGLKPEGLTVYSDIEATDWFAGWVAVASCSGLIGWDGAFPLWTAREFRGEEPTTRAEAAMLLANLLGRR